jgi:hypothetical protein
LAIARTLPADRRSWIRPEPARRPEECFQAAKNEAGLDHYQVRQYESWYRYVTLAMLALAFLAVTRAALAGDDAGLASSANEIRRMLTALCSPPLVTMAPPTPGTRPPMSLPATTTTRSLSAAGY